MKVLGFEMIEKSVLKVKDAVKDKYTSLKSASMELSWEFSSKGLTKAGQHLI